MDKEMVNIKDKPVSFSDIEAFVTNNLAKDPDDTAIKVNRMANDSLYLPIGHIEKLLDNTYMGLWETVNFRYQVVANEITGSIDLRVLHPKLHIWITRTGTASTLIQQKKGTKDITDINAKIKNTLVKDLPHLKAECVKNAAKSLGDAFGRSLNRDEKGDYELKNDAEDYDTWIQAIENCDTIDELNKMGKENKETIAQDQYLIKQFQKRKKELS